MLSIAERSESFQTQRLVVQTDIRLSEILSALSVALDITQGQPKGHCMRTALVGMRLAEEIKLPAQDRSALFYALLMKDLGCSSNAAKISYLFGADDHLVKSTARLTDWTKPGERLRHCWNNCATGGSTFDKIAKMASLVSVPQSEARAIAEIRCDRGATIARMLQLPERTVEAIYHLDEHWNGRGNPQGLRHQEIPLLARICCLAQTVEVFFTAHGVPAALDVARQRRGTWFDPELVDALLMFGKDPGFWERLLGDGLVVELSRCEHEDTVWLADEECLDRVSEAFAMVVDAKSPWTYKHSARVATIAVGVAEEFECSRHVLRDVRRAALLHDIGKLGVSNSILDKPGKPTAEEFEQIRKHPDFTERVLQQVQAFQDLADIAAAHHERLDGRGYHRRRDGSQLPQLARILAVADMCEAMTAKRPYRNAMSWEKAYEIMAKDAGQGVDPECLSALARWYERVSFGSRVEEQLDQIERLLSSANS